MPIQYPLYTDFPIDDSWFKQKFSYSGSEYRYVAYSPLILYDFASNYNGQPL